MYKKLLRNMASFKNLNLTPRAVRTIQAYIVSRTDDETTRNTGTIGKYDTIELYDTIKKFTGIELEFYKNEDGKIMLEEITESGSRMVEFQEAEEVSEYLEHLTYLGLQGKINNKKLSIVRDAESAEEKDIEFRTGIRTGDRKVSVYKQNEYILTNEEGQIEENPTTEALKRTVADSFSSMSITDLNRFSKFEYKKMISAKYADVVLTSKEMEALDFYKGSRIYSN